MLYRIDAIGFSIEFLLLRRTAFDNLSIQLFAGLSVARKGNHLVERKFEKSEAMSQEQSANDWVLNQFFKLCGKFIQGTVFNEALRGKQATKEDA